MLAIDHRAKTEVPVWMSMTIIGVNAPVIITVKSIDSLLVLAKWCVFICFQARTVKVVSESDHLDGILERIVFLEFYNPSSSNDNCRPNICNTGRCVSLQTTYYCQCPNDRYGEHCEKRMYWWMFICCQIDIVFLHRLFQTSSFRSATVFWFMEGDEARHEQRRL